jgi:predicted nucleotidyltransferase
MREARFPPAVDAALREVKSRLSERFGERLREVRLYGSLARGDAGPNSDIDVLVVLDVVADLAERADVMELIAGVALERELPIEALVLSVDELDLLRRRETALAHAIERDGALI